MGLAEKPRAVADDAEPSGRLSDLAYARILESLFDRRVPAGAFLSQGELVKLTGVPVAPLRDALRVLEGEGVLVIQPRSGIQFFKPGLELTKSTYQFRTIVERAAVRVFAETADDEFIARLIDEHEKLVRRIETEGLDEEQRAAVEQAEEIHYRIIDSLANPLIEKSYLRMRHYLRLMWMDRKLTVPLALRSLREHLEILHACARRDPDAAEAALQAHFTAALQRHMGMF